MCDYTSWSISDIYNAIKNVDGIKRKKLEIPRFQRFRCWNDSEKESKLIESLEKNFPINCVTFFKVSESRLERFVILDGLQRITTIYKYVEDPLAFNININRIKEFVDTLVTEDDEDFKDKLERVCAYWFDSELLGECISPLGAKGIKSDLQKKLSEQILIVFGEKDRDLVESIVEFTEKLAEDICLAKYNVLIMLCNCREDELYEVFERLNTTGIILKEYEISSASWNRPEYALKISNQNVLEGILKYYQRLSESYAVKNTACLELTEKDEENTFNCCEYIFGLAEYLNKKHPNMYTCQKGKTFNLSHEFVFKLVALCLTNKSSISTDIPNTIMDLYNTKKLTAFEDTLIYSFELISETIANLFSFGEDFVIIASLLDEELMYLLVNTYALNAEIKQRHRTYWVDLFSLKIFYWKMTKSFKKIVGKDTQLSGYASQIKNKDLITCLDKAYLIEALNSLYSKQKNSKVKTHKTKINSPIINKILMLLIKRKIKPNNKWTNKFTNVLSGPEINEINNYINNSSLDTKLYVESTCISNLAFDFVVNNNKDSLVSNLKQIRLKLVSLKNKKTTHDTDINDLVSHYYKFMQIRFSVIRDMLCRLYGSCIRSEHDVLKNTFTTTTNIANNVSKAKAVTNLSLANKNTKPNVKCPIVLSIAKEVKAIKIVSNENDSDDDDEEVIDDENESSVELSD